MKANLFQIVSPLILLAACGLAFISGGPRVDAAAAEAAAWQPDIESARRLAGQTNRLVLIHFWSTSCGPCMRMEHEVFSKPEVMKAILVNYVPVKLDANAFPITAQQYGITSIPTDIVTTPAGIIVQKRTGGIGAKQYVDTMTMIANTARPGASAVAHTNPAPNGHLDTLASGNSTDAVSVGAPPPSWGSNPNHYPLPNYASDHQPSATATATTSGVPWGQGYTPQASSAAPPSNSSLAANAATPATAGQGTPGANPFAQNAPSQNSFAQNSAAGAGAPAPWSAGAGSVPPWAAGSTPAPAVSAPTQLAQNSPWAVNGAGTTLPTQPGSHLPAQSAAIPPTPDQVSAMPAGVFQPSNAPAVAPQPAAIITNPWASAAAAHSSGPSTAPVFAPPAGAAGPANMSAANNMPAHDAPVSPVLPAATLRPVSAPASVPPRNPPLGLDGFDPVRLIDRHQWTPGDRQWGAIHLGRTYLFSGHEEQQKFLANPLVYAPALSGDDAVVKIDHGQSVPGQRQFGTFYDKRVYLFSCQDSLNRFHGDPLKYTGGVRQAELQLETIRR
jgi:YHS domain-containing protein/thiol-disulfide isomerase/thioredoxin